MFHPAYIGISFGSANYAAVGGRITDPQGRAFTGATVQLTSVSTRAERQATSNEQGIFQITGLLPGEYEMKVQAPNFATLTQSHRIEANQQLTLNLTLKVASVQDVVEVQDLAPALHPTDASVGEVVEPVAIEDLPLNGRKLVDLVLTAPGAHSGMERKREYESCLLAPGTEIGSKYWRQPPKCELLPARRRYEYGSHV